MEEVNGISKKQTVDIVSNDDNFEKFKPDKQRHQLAKKAIQRVFGQLNSNSRNLISSLTKNNCCHISASFDTKRSTFLVNEIVNST